METSIKVYSIIEVISDDIESSDFGEHMATNTVFTSIERAKEYAEVVCDIPSDSWVYDEILKRWTSTEDTENSDSYNYIATHELIYNIGEL